MGEEGKTETTDYGSFPSPPTSRVKTKAGSWRRGQHCVMGVARATTVPQQEDGEREEERGREGELSEAGLLSLSSDFHAA